MIVVTCSCRGRFLLMWQDFKDACYTNRWRYFLHATTASVFVCIMIMVLVIKWPFIAITPGMMIMAWILWLAYMEEGPRFWRYHLVFRDGDIEKIKAWAERQYMIFEADWQAIDGRATFVCRISFQRASDYMLCKLRWPQVRS